jgi:hypothetical protein
MPSHHTSITNLNKLPEKGSIPSKVHLYVLHKLSETRALCLINSVDENSVLILDIQINKFSVFEHVPLDIILYSISFRIFLSYVATISHQEFHYISTSTINCLENRRLTLAIDFFKVIKNKVLVLSFLCEFKI